MVGTRFFAAGFAVGLAGLLLAGCGLPDVAVPEISVPGADVPANFPAPAYGPAANPPDAATFAVGRSLFYGPLLSRDGSVSCGSCHQQVVAFAHQDHKLSHGVKSQLGTRDAPALQNLRWKPNLLWDGGAGHLETMPLTPLTNPVKMDETLPNMLRKLNADAGYTRRFAAVYGPEPIDSYRFLRALAQFTTTLTSANSRYDNYVRGEGLTKLSTAELRGRALVVQKCASCHSTDLVTRPGLNQATRRRGNNNGQTSAPAA